MKFKTKLLSAVLFSAIGVASSSQAVVLSEDGQGQVLLYPYYSVQNGNETYLSVVNTTGKAKAVKVRFLEAKNSREVLDFNLYLSEHDVWTAAIVPSGDGAAVRSADNSCTAPLLSSGSGGSSTASYRQQAFRNSAYAGDGAGDGLDRTKEGYIEIIEMGEIDPAYVLPSSGSAAVNFEKAVTHTPAGVPNNCDAVIAEWKAGSPFPVAGGVSAVVAPTSGLIGRAEIINVNKGIDFPYDPVALDWFSLSANHTEPGSELPSLTQADPQDSTIATGVLAAGVLSFDVLTTHWGLYGTSPAQVDYNTADPVSAVLMRSAVMNEFSTEAGLGARTDWVVNFPTKRFYMNNPVAADTTIIQSQRPFSKNWTKDGACEQIGLTAWDREEAQTAADIDFSPKPIDPTVNEALCWEVNVLTINDSNALGGELTKYSVGIKYSNGWIDMAFPRVDLAGKQKDAGTANAQAQFRHEMVALDWDWGGVGAAPTTDSLITGPTTVSGQVYKGLPVIGFSAQALVNNAVKDGVMAHYSSTAIHKYRRN